MNATVSSKARFGAFTPFSAVRVSTYSVDPMFLGVPVTELPMRNNPLGTGPRPMPGKRRAVHRPMGAGMWNYSGRMCAVATQVLCAMLLFQRAAIAGSADSQIVWQSRNDTYSELSREFGSLYKGLLNFKDAGIEVDATTVVVQPGQRVEEALRAHHLFDGPYMPIQVDVLVCRLNLDACVARPGKSGKWTDEDARTDWRIQPGATIVVPNVQFEGFIVHKTYTKKRLDSWKNIVVRDRRGCDTYDEACQRYIRNLNRDKAIADDTVGEVRVPTRADRGVISMHSTRSTTFEAGGSVEPQLIAAARALDQAVRADGAPVEAYASADVSERRSRFVSWLTSLSGRQQSKDVATLAPMRSASAVRFHVEPLNSAALGLTPAPPSADPAIGQALRQDKEFASRVLPTVHVKPDSHPAVPVPVESAASNRTRLLQLISHPIVRDPNAIKLPPTGQAPVVVVMDTQVDVMHCLLGNISDIRSSSQAASAIPGKEAAERLKPAHCGEPDTAVYKDHGTHVAGLVGTKPGSIIGSGVDPKAIIKTAAINSDAFRTDALYASLQASVLRSLYRTEHPPLVINFSFDYIPKAGFGTNDAMLELIDEERSATLFVVSVGDDGVPLLKGQSCTMPFVCHGAPNVVTVGAVDFNAANPGMQHNSNGASDHGNYVDLGAPGADVVSTIMNNKVGVMSGTSQAAPIVSAAASLLYLKKSFIRPWEVRHRLIYTSDLFPGLYDAMFGGRLNIARLLAFETDQITDHNATHFVDVDGPDKLVRFTVVKTASDDFEGSPSQVEVPFAQIRRLYRQDGLNYWVLYREAVAADKTRVLIRNKVQLLDPMTTLSYSLPDNASGGQRAVNVYLKDVQDFVSSSLQ